MLTTESDKDLLELQSKDLGFVFSWSMGRIENILSDSIIPNPLSKETCSADTLKLITLLVEEQSIPEAEIGLSSGISAFLWLYISILGYLLVSFLVYRCPFNVFVRFILYSSPPPPLTPSISFCIVIQL